MEAVGTFDTLICFDTFLQHFGWFFLKGPYMMSGKRRSVKSLRTLIRRPWKHPNNESNWKSERKPKTQKFKNIVVAHTSERPGMLMSSLPEHQTLTPIESILSSRQSWEQWRTYRPAVLRKVCTGVSRCLQVFFFPLALRSFTFAGCVCACEC